MLVKPHQIFRDALGADYAIGAFNTSNMEVTQAIVAAAEQQRSPVIVQTSEGAIEYAGLEVLSGIIKTVAGKASVPVILHLDHGKSLDTVKTCIEAGYTSVMIDASTKPYEENVRVTRAVVEYAHERGVWVEAELGAILGKEGAVGLRGGRTPESYFTDPKEAKEFVAATNVDALAVSVGTIHGAFTGQEYIRFELLESIQAAVPDLPLVLHGASGIADEHLRQACRGQVTKVNVDTELRLAFDQAVRAALGATKDLVDPREILGAAREAVQQVVEQKIRLFGSESMAKVY